MADEIASPKEKEKEKDINPVELPIPDELPVLPLNDFVFFPGMGFPLQISNKPSRQLIDDALLKDRLVAVVSLKKTADKKSDATATDNLYSIGSACYIHKLIKNQGRVLPGGNERRKKAPRSMSIPAGSLICGPRWKCWR